MAHIEIPVNFTSPTLDRKDADLLKEADNVRKTAAVLFDEGNYMESLERTLEAMRVMREVSDFETTEFRALLSALLFDLAETHYELKDYKQSEKELDVLFKVLDNLVRLDSERFGAAHILAMELSTRILRSRKKAMDMLVRQQINASALYDKVNSGMVAATDKLVDSLYKVGQLLASSGDYKAALKFYAEAIKYSKKRSGKVTRKEVKMTIEMAKIMMRLRQMRPRARRLLNAILPHAVNLGTIELENDILSLIEIIDNDVEHEPRWRLFMHRLNLASKARERREKMKAEKEAKKANGLDNTDK